MVFELNNTYKIKIESDNHDYLVFTITVTFEDDIFIRGLDKFEKERGINKNKIIDFMKIENGGENYE